MAQPIGVAGVRTVNKKPQHKTVPIRRVIRDSGVANNAPARRKPSPPPSWTRPLHTSLTPRPQPKRVRIPSPVTDPQFHFPSAQTLIARGNRHDRNVQARSAHKAARQDVLHSLGLGPARTIRSVGFAPSPPMLIGDQRRGALLRDSGVANNPSPTYHGQALSPQAISHAMATVLRGGHSLQAQGAIGLLHAAGVSDPFGSRTPRETAAARRAQAHYRAQLIHALTAKQLAFQNTLGRGGLGAAPREIAAKLNGLPTSELERLTRWKPSQGDIQRGQISTAGFSMQGLQQLGDALGGLTSGAVISKVPGTAGKILGHAAGDLLEIPGEAVPSLYRSLEPLAHGDVVETAKRFGEPFVDLAKHPAKSFVEHPLGTVLMATGAVRGLGRGAGFALRHGTESMRAAGSLDRGVARLPETQFKEVRRYSPDVLVKQIQKSQDLRGYRKAHQFYKQADQAEREAVQIKQRGGDAEGKFRLAAHMREQAYRADPSVITDASKVGLFGKTVLQRAHDEFESLAEGLRRLDRGRVVREASKALGRKPSNLTRPVVEGIVAASRKHVEDYLGQIRDEARGFDPVVDRGKLLANEQLQAQIKKALDNPKTDMVRVLAAAERYRKVVAPRQHELANRGLIHSDRAEKAALASYAVRHMGAKFEPAHDVELADGTTKHISDRIVGPHGKSFTPNEIRAHMAAARAEGEPFISDPAYVSQQPYLRSSGAYFKRWNPRVGIQTGQRTGKAVTQGTIDAHPTTLIDQAARTQSLLSADKAFSDHIDQFAYRRSDGKVFTAGTKKKVMEMKRGLEAHGSPVQWRAVRLNPLGAEPEALDHLLNSTAHDEHTATQGVHKLLQDAYEGADNGKGPWALIPEQVAARAGEFQKLLGAQAGVKAIQKATSIFRKVVLQRPSFITGNNFEATVRGVLKGALPGTPDYFMMRRILDALPETQRDSILQGVIGGGHMHMVSSAHVRRTVDQLGDGRIARASQGVAHTVPARLITSAWDHWNHLLFETINARIERQFRIALAGKAARQQLFPQKLLVLSNKAVAEAAHGLTDTATQRLLGREVDRAYGQYDKFSPEMRRWLMLYTPFAAWIANSIRFVLQTLPRDHPVVTGLVAAAAQTSDDWRKAHGLTQINSKGVKQVPGFLQGTIPGGDGSYLRAFTRYTPAGFWSDPLASAGGAIMPQLNGVEAAFAGTDWKGTPLKDKSTLGRLDEAFKEAAAEIVPGLGQYQQIGTGKGTTEQRLRKFVDPFMFTKSNASSRPHSPRGRTKSPVDQALDAIGSGASKSAVDQALKAIGG